MADPIVHIPLPGPWNVDGSNRQYDWIGPDSSLPPAGFVFRTFDRFIPFTQMIRVFRRIFGIGGDDLDGSSAGSTSASGKVTVETGRHPAIDRSILEHELVHQRQNEEYQEGWHPDNDPGDDAEEGWIAYVNDPRIASPVEIEAYEASIGVVGDWLREHCPDFEVSG